MVLTRSRAGSPSLAGASSTDAAVLTPAEGLLNPASDAGAHSVRAAAAAPAAGAPLIDAMSGAILPQATVSPAVGAAGAAVMMTNEQLMFLINRLSREPSVSNTAFNNNFSKCTARFDGEKSSDVVAFIDAIETYKECARIEDDIALRGLSMLLTKLAATWWQGVKATTATWPDAISALKNTFGPRLPPHQIYRKLFEREQRLHESTDLFVCHLRALIAQLPLSSLKEEVQLDMIYGLLHVRIREKVARSTFATFGELLTCARRVEDILKEIHPQSTSSPSRPLSVPEPSLSTEKKRPHCVYCKKYGHLKDDCLRLKERRHKGGGAGDDEKEKPIVTCFGCGAPGVIRSNCSTCIVKKETVTSAFQSVSASAVNLGSRVRPVISVHIYGKEGKLLVDTGAKHSIGSVSLRNHLFNNGHQFETVFTELKYADGRMCAQNVEVAHVNVMVRGVELTVSFIMLPCATESLLGMNFIHSVGMVLNFDLGVWYVRHDKTPQPLRFEGAVDQLLRCASVSLREDEGSHLKSEDRGRLGRLLNVHGDIFSPGGGPTKFATHHINTGNATPIAGPPYRVSPAKKETSRKEFTRIRVDVKQRVEDQQDIRKATGDRCRRDVIPYKEGDLVLVETHLASNAAKGFTSKFAPRREGPYRVSQVITPTSFVIVDTTGEIRGKYHASALTPYVGDTPVVRHPRRRGRPAKSRSGRPCDLEGEVIANSSTPRPGPQRECRRSSRIAAAPRRGQSS